MKLTIGIPAYKAEDHICDCLSSINIQDNREYLEVIIAKDNPDDDYEFVKERFPKLNIEILECEQNTGPGLARQRCLNAATGDWITFIDADDVFLTPFVMNDFHDAITSNCVVVQGQFYQMNDDHSILINNDLFNPWVFAKFYNVKFLRDYGIEFSELRAMEDGEFNWKIRMTVEGSDKVINVIDKPLYVWRPGSEHSITRIGQDLHPQNIPQYNFDLCQWGSTEAAVRAINFCMKKNAFNGNIMKFATEIMISQYFTYVETCERYEIFAEQNFFNAKKFYNECYKKFEPLISEDIVTELYTAQYGNSGPQLVGIIPKITFFDFMDKVKSEEYRGDEEFKEIRSRLPQSIINNDLKSGVLGKE